MEAATAMMAFLGPRRPFKRRNCAPRYVFLVLVAAHATWTKMVLSHGAPMRRRVERRLPALSSLRGHMPAQESRCPAVGKRDMSAPISERMTCADTSLTPGMVFRVATAT